MHELRCLGEATLRSPSGDLIHFRSRKHLALLIYLSLNADRAHRRERLAGLFWSDGEDSRARHSLSQALYAVRRLLGEAVRIEGEDLELDPVGLAVDALEMERKLRGGDAIAAADLYHGEFLEGFWVRGAQGFEEWAGRERSRFAALARDALRQAIRTARDRCDWPEVQRRAARLVELDRLDETAYGELMRALWIVGDRGAALDRYDDLTQTLATELQSTPSIETAALADRIRQRPVRGGWVSERSPQDRDYSIFHHPPFVGRKDELAVLAEERNQVLAGESRTVRLSGGAGIGKTRLAEEFLTSLELSDVIILRSRCYEAEQSLPYGAVADGLKQLLEQSDLSEVSPLWLAELARIVPEVQERYGELPEPAHLGAEGGRRRLYEGIARTLRAACDAGAVVLFIDDLHWADDSSFALLHYLHRRVTNGLYLLLAHRSEELAARDATHTSDLLAAENPRVRSIVLQNLDRDESTDLLCTLLRDGQSAAALSSVREMAGGNPFFAVELARSLTEAEAGDQDEVPAIPDSIRALLNRRFARLSDRAAALLQQAAILGSRSTYETLRAATGLPALEADSVLRELTRMGVLTNADDELTFRHDLIREVAVLQIPSSLTGSLHRKAARALIRTHGDPGEIALHLAAADDTRRAFRYALRGADAAEDIYALEEATDLLRLAIQHSPDPATKSDLVARLGKLYFHIREYSKARRLLQERLDFVAHHEFPQLDIFEARQATLFVEVYSGAISAEHAGNVLSQFYSELIRCGLDAPRLEADILRALLWTGARSLNPAQVESTVAKLRGLHERVHEPQVRCRTARSLGIYECYKGHLDKAESLLERALELASTTNDETAVLDAYIGLTALLHRTMRKTLAERILKSALRLAEHHADPALISAILCNCAVCYVYHREHTVAERLLARAENMLRSSGDYPDTTPSVLFNIGFLAYTKGESNRAEDYWRRAVKASEAHGILPVKLESLASLGLMALKTGRIPEARHLAAQALRLARRGKFLLDQRFGLEELVARLRFRSGQEEKALIRLAKIANLARDQDLPLYFNTQVTRLELLASQRNRDAVNAITEDFCRVAQAQGANWWTNHLRTQAARFSE